MLTPGVLFLMKVFIAGATGILGRRVVSLLVRGQHQVVGLSRSDANDSALRDQGAEPRRGDLFNRDQMVDCSADCDAVVHLATAIPTKSRAKTSDWALNDRIRREGTAALLTAALNNKAKLYIQQSVTFLYGDRNGEWVDESVPIAATQLPIIRSAADMEALVADAVLREHLPAIILRFGSFYSHDSRQTGMMFELARKRQFPIMGDGSPYWNMLRADDAAAAVVQALETGQRNSGKVFNVCEREPVQYGEFVQLLASTAGAAPPRRLPSFAARWLLGRDTAQFLLASVRCKSTAAHEHLGWSPQYPSLREGLRHEFERWTALRNT